MTNENLRQVRLRLNQTSKKSPPPLAKSLLRALIHRNIGLLKLLRAGADSFKHVVDIAIKSVPIVQ